MRNLKRALSMALAAIMVLGLMVVGASATSYEDFTDKDEIVNKEAVNTMVSLGVISGKEDGSYYAPADSLTRAEACTLIARMLGGGKDPVLGSNIKSNFTDTQGHWAETYIAYCANLGIIVGVGDGSFNPDGVLTGTAAAKMMLCALGYKPEFEGIGGANWELATNTLATKVKLYEDLEDLNPSETISRDDVAQLLYNGVQAQEVEYRNLEGDYQGTLYATEIGTMLANRFKVVKVEGVLVANEVYGIAGNGKTVAGKSRLTDANGYTDANGNYQTYAGTYNIAIDNDYMGKRVVIYVQFKNNLAPNAESAVVLGEPILSNDNTVASTSARLKDADAVEDFLDDNGLAIGTADELNGVYHATKDGVSRAATTVNNASVYDAPSLAAGVNPAAGRLVTFIDHNGDGTVDFIFTELKQLGRVSAYNEDKSEITLSYVGTQKFSDVVGVENVAKGDIVLYVKYGNTYYVEQAETVEGQVSSFQDGTITSVTIDSTNYVASAVDFDSSTGLTDHANGSGMASMVGNTYTLYLDSYGNGIAWKETELSDSNLALIMASGAETDVLGNPKGEVKLMLADGTTGTYTVDLLASANRYNIADNLTSTLATSGITNAEKEAWMARALNDTFANANGVADGYTFNNEGSGNGLQNTLVAVSIDGSKVVLGDPSKVNSNYGVADYTGAGTISVGRTVSSYNFTNSYQAGKMKPTDNKGAATVVVNDSTLFFFFDDVAGTADGVAQGLSKLPTTGITVDATNMKAIYTTQANGTKVAKAVFCDGIYQSSYDYAYVTGRYTETKLANGESVYTYPVVLETGETSTLSTKVGGVYTDTVVRYEPDTTAGYYVFTTAAVDAAIENGFVVTSTDGLAIHVKRGISGDVDSFTASKSMVIWNVENTANVVEDSLGIGTSVCLVKDGEGYVKTVFVNDTDLEFSTVTNNTGIASLDYVFNPDNEAITADTYPVSVSGGYSLKLTGLGAYAGQWVNYSYTAVGASKTEYGSAQIAADGTVSIGMPDVESTVSLYSIGAKDTSHETTTTPGTQLDSSATADDLSAAFKASNSVVIDDTFFAPSYAINVPSGKSLTIKGDFEPTSMPAVSGTLVVEGDAKLPAGTVRGTMEFKKDLELNAATEVKGTLTAKTLSGTGALTVANGGKTTVETLNNAAVTVQTGGELTLKENNTLVTASNIGGTLNVDAGKKVTAASSSTITLDGTTIKGAVDMTNATTLNMKGAISVESGSELTFNNATVSTSATLTVKSGATLHDNQPAAFATNLTGIIEAGATMTVQGTEWIVPADETTGYLALSTGKVTVETGKVTIDGAVKLLQNIKLLGGDDIYTVNSGSLDLNGKKLEGKGTSNDLVIKAGVTVTGLTGDAMNFYDNTGTQINDPTELADKTFDWDTNANGSGAAGWKAQA